MLGVQKKKTFKQGIMKPAQESSLIISNPTHTSSALLISPPTSDLRPPKTVRSSATGVKLKEPIMENKRFLEKVEEYLISDSYMYAPLVVPPQSISASPQEPS